MKIIKGDDMQTTAVLRAFPGRPNLNNVPHSIDGCAHRGQASATCQTCADVVHKATVVESSEVAVEEVEYTARRALHTKYAIDGVPCVVLADARGVVRASFLGPVTATDLWASLAAARDGTPGPST